MPDSYITADEALQYALAELKRECIANNKQPTQEEALAAIERTERHFAELDNKGNNDNE
jgi:hypothetical protein